MNNFWYVFVFVNVEELNGNEKEMEMLMFLKFNYSIRINILEEKLFYFLYGCFVVKIFEKDKIRGGINCGFMD